MPNLRNILIYVTKIVNVNLTQHRLKKDAKIVKTRIYDFFLCTYATVKNINFKNHSLSKCQNNLGNFLTIFELLAMILSRDNIYQN
jgi:hypothetical protein